MNQLAHNPSQLRLAHPGDVVAAFAAAVGDAAAVLFGRAAHAHYAPPQALRHPVSKRGQRFLRGGE